LNERKAYFSLRLILAAVRQRHRSEIAPLAISVRRSKHGDRDRRRSASWISTGIVSMLSTGFSVHSHQRSKERRANFTRVLFQRQFTDKLHDAIFDDIGFNADP
jgi:hypothetical protein